MNEDATFLALKDWIPYSARNFKAMIFNKSNSELIFKNWNTLTFEKRTGYTIDDPYFIIERKTI